MFKIQGIEKKTKLSIKVANNRGVNQTVWVSRPICVFAGAKPTSLELSASARYVQNEQVHCSSAV